MDDDSDDDAEDDTLGLLLFFGPPSRIMWSGWDKHLIIVFFRCPRIVRAWRSKMIRSLAQEKKIHTEQKKPKALAQPSWNVLCPAHSHEEDSCFPTLNGIYMCMEPEEKGLNRAAIAEKEKA